MKDKKLKFGLALLAALALVFAAGCNNDPGYEDAGGDTSGGGGGGIDFSDYSIADFPGHWIDATAEYTNYPPGLYLYGAGYYPEVSGWYFYPYADMYNDSDGEVLGYDWDYDSQSGQILLYESRGGNIIEGIEVKVGIDSADTLTLTAEFDYSGNNDNKHSGTLTLYKEASAAGLSALKAGQNR